MRILKTALATTAAAAVLLLTGTPAGAQPTGAQEGSCASGYLCLWGGPNYTGPKLALYRCGWTNLGAYPYPGGGTWADKASSLVNNQTGGAVSFFYDNGVQVLDQHSYGYRDNLAYDGVNDIIDAIRVC